MILIKNKSRKQDSIQRLLTDTHSPSIIRINNVIKNNDFIISLNDKLYL